MMVEQVIRFGRLYYEQGIKMQSYRASYCVKLLSYADVCWTCVRSVAVKRHCSKVYVFTVQGKSCIVTLLKFYDN
jgi:hypothetical protein